MEVFVRRSQARQRQITIGKSRPEYKLYANAVPFHRRTEHMPQTPDPHARISKRAFDRELACWRRGLHVWSGHVEGVSAGHSPKRHGGAGDQPNDEKRWADVKDWSPAGTESTRADSEASSPHRLHCQTPGQAGADYRNVKLNLFQHLSLPEPTQNQSANGGNSVPAAPQMLPAMPTIAPWDFPSALNAAPMGALPMMQFAPVDQQQPCSYTVACNWGEPMAPWTSGQSMPQSQPAMTLGQPPANLMQPAEAMAAANEVQLGQALMWQPSGPQKTSPGTPRSSQNQAKVEDAPCTPLMTRGSCPVVSPGLTSPWLRTPSPDHAHYNMAQFKAQQQQQQQQQLQQQQQQQQQICAQGPGPADVDPWATATLMVATRNYFAESEGYLSVAIGSPVRAMLENPHCGDGKCAWPTYVYCSQGNSMGWVPQQILWRCYVDDAGRRWASDDATCSWCWVDEMEMNSQ